MSRFLTTRRRRFYLPAVAMLVAAALVPSIASGSGVPAGGDRTTGVTAVHQASTGRASGRFVQAKTYSKPPKPNAAQLAELTAESTLDNKLPPKLNYYRGPVPKPINEPFVRPDRVSASAFNTPAVFRNTNLPGGQRSGVSEPTVDQAGKSIFATGNWFAGYSQNNGANWTFLNPFSIFGSGFCCDQLSAYSSPQNREFWLAQYDNRLVVANSAANNLASWCYYNFTPASMNLPTSYSFDYNHMALSTRYVWVTTNVYTSTGYAGAMVFRIGIDDMIACPSSVNFGYFGPRPTEFSNAFTQGAGDVMYWGTNSTNMTAGSTFRVLRWADNSNSISQYDRNITPFTYMQFGGSQNCGSQDGVVKNWCARSDSRMGGGYIAFPSTAQRNSGSGYNANPENDAVIGFAFGAKNDANHPKPYIRRIYFTTDDMTYLGYSEFWASWGGLLYPDVAANQRGHVGFVFAWGGGTGSTHYYPSWGYGLDDETNPTQLWYYAYNSQGAGNPCLNSDNLRRWGDYLTVRPAYPNQDAFVGIGYRLLANAGTCGSTVSSEVKTLVWGRERDRAAWNRWSIA